MYFAIKSKKDAVLLLSCSLSSARKIHSEYVALPPISKADLPLTIGVSSTTLLVTGPIAASPENFSVFASLEVNSKTEDSLPPNFAGIFPLYISAEPVLNGFIAEKIPKK